MAHNHQDHCTEQSKAMTFKIVLIEDEDREVLPQRIEELGGGEFEVVAMPPPRNLGLTALSHERADLFLVDYELDSQQTDGSVAPYLGMTFAARLREKLPQYPIALLTRSDLPKWTDARRTVSTGSSFDAIVYKDTDLKDDPTASRNRLLSLASGYQILRDGRERSVSALLELLATDEAGRRSAEEAQPPSDGWMEFEAARWIRTVLLGYPGVLYDSRHAATAVGLSFESFSQQPVLDLLRDAEYRGPFLEEGKRWWRHSLFDVANRISSASYEGQSMKAGFRMAAGKVLDQELGASLDAETGIAPADTVCHLLGIPVRIETSLPYRPDSRPLVMDQARISFKAIRETNDFEEMHVDPSSRVILYELLSSP